MALIRVLGNGDVRLMCGGSGGLTAEAVQGAALTFQGVDYNHGSGSLPLGMLGVGDVISDDLFNENLQDVLGLHARCR